eukprot:366165-Chlamydomonas_euryale.AAC.1
MASIHNIHRPCHAPATLACAAPPQAALPPRAPDVPPMLIALPRAPDVPPKPDCCAASCSTAISQQFPNCNRPNRKVCRAQPQSPPCPTAKSAVPNRKVRRAQPQSPPCPTAKSTVPNRKVCCSSSPPCPTFAARAATAPQVLDCDRAQLPGVRSSPPPHPPLAACSASAPRLPPLLNPKP